MPFSPLSPTATRESGAIKKRIQSQRLKAYDKYKSDLEQAEGARLKAIADATSKDDSSRSDRSEEYNRSLFLDADKEVTEEDDDEIVSSRTSSAHADLYFKKVNLLGKIINKFVFEDIKYELKWWEFVCITFSLQVPLVYILRHIYMVNLWGATLVLIVYIVTLIVIAMPVFMAYMFLGNYSRRCYIKFWDCAPILRGVAYSIVLLHTLYEVLNMAFAGMALLYLKNVIAVEVPWVSCNFTNAHPDCVPMYAKHEPFTAKCCHEFMEGCDLRILDQSIKYGALDYYYSYMLKRSHTGRSSENNLIWNWVAAVTVEWVFMFILMIMGVRRFRSFMTVINVVILCLFIPVIIASLIISPHYGMIKQVHSKVASIFDYKFWIQVAAHTLHRELPSDIVTYSAVSKPGVSTTVDTVSIYSMKLLFMTVLTVWLSIAVKTVQDYYKVQENTCIRARGDHFIFAIIPDLISRWPIPQIWLVLYFAIIFFWGFSSSVYVLNSFLESVIEAFPYLVKWRFLLAGFYCLAVGATNVFFLRSNYTYLVEYITTQLFVQMKITLLFISLLGLFIYSLDRFKNDYHFTYGTMLSGYWIHGIKIAMLLLGILFVITFVIKVAELTVTEICVMCVMLAPILIGVVISVLSYLVKMKPTLFDSDPKWGPPGRRRKLARRRFDPTHELHYRSTSQICKHPCLLRSAALKKDVKHWQTKKIIFAHQFARELAQFKEE